MTLASEHEEATHLSRLLRATGGCRSEVQGQCQGSEWGNGDIEDNLLVYQQFRQKGSGLRFFDVTSLAQNTSARSPHRKPVPHGAPIS